VTMRFKVERESEPDSFGQLKQPCEGAWPGAYLDDSGQPRIGWFVTLEEAPTEVEGYSVRLSEAAEEGVAGHIIIQDRS
jgi:hypothetical protein